MFLDTSTQNIRRRVAIVGTILIVMPMLTLCLAGCAVFHRLQRSMPGVEPVAAAPRADVSRLAQQLLEKCKRYREETINSLGRSQQILNGMGAIRLDGTSRFIWRAKNETTGQIKSFQVPLMIVGEQKFVAVTGFEQSAPAVDEITKATGAKATIFQKLNDHGDLLRVASSVKAADGSRLINSFVPAEGCDAATAKIRDEVLAGKSYLGLQTDGAASYLTAYHPLKNSHGAVVGILQTVMPEDQIKEEVRNLLAKASTGPEAPEFFVWEASGEARPRTIAMSGPSMEGTDLWNQKDRAGRLYVRELCARAIHLNSDTWADYQYQRAKRAGGLPGNVTARFTFIPDLHWVVGLAQPESDSEASMPLGQLLVWAMWLLFGVSVASTGLAVRIWIEFSRNFAVKLTDSFEHLRRDAKQLSDVAVELSHEAEHAMEERTAPQLLDMQHQPSAAWISESAVRKESPAVQEEIRQALVSLDSSRASLAKLIKVFDRMNAPDSGFSSEWHALAAQCRETAHRLDTELEQSQQNLQLARPKLAANHPAGEETTTALRRQTETLLRFAAGLDRTVDSVRADLGVEKPVAIR